ncbi:MAG: prepilin peptidase [Candidatus Diapherotrites archaeon]
MFEVIFLIVLGLIWILFAVVQDLKKREIANWLNFSLIIFALGFRLFYSLFFDSNLIFFYQGLIGFVLFFFLGNMLYYGRVFAGGDAKLMIALGAILPLSESLYANLNLFFLFFILFLIVGAVYGLIFSLVLAIRNNKNFKREFTRKFVKNRMLFHVSLIVSLIFVFISFFNRIFIYPAILVFLSPYIYFSAKAIDEVCMIKKVPVSKLTEGDWLYKDVRIGRKIIKASWDGLSREEINLLKNRYKKVLIRRGIPFSPVFLISYLIFFLLINKISFI